MQKNAEMQKNVENSAKCSRSLKYVYRPKNRNIGIDVIYVDAPYKRNAMLSKKTHEMEL